MPGRSDARFVEACGHRLEYVDIAARATRRPELVFLHEGLGSVSMWRDFPETIAHATGCRTIVYSRVGHGRSSKLGGPHRPDFMHVEAQTLLPAVRDALSIANPVLIGHSTGASMALIHAGAARAPVAAVIAMAPLCFVEEFNLASIREARHAFTTTDFRRRLARHHDDVEAVFTSWNDIWLSDDFKSWSIESDLRGITCPVLAILGESDEYSTPAQIETIARSATRSRAVELLRLANCGHSPHKDQPAAVLEAIVAFLSRTGVLAARAG
jgi:pimeloyl-ACP methyl ester carboxylesterase